MKSDGARNFQYHTHNKLALTDGGYGVGGTSLNYDALGRLYQTEKMGETTTRFAYSGQRLIAEYSSSNSVLRRYVHGPGIDEPLLWYEGSGTSDKRYLHADERGSIIAGSNASGSVLFKNKYDDYGKPGQNNEGRFQYTGQLWLDKAELYYYKARIYHPGLGRFMQADPTGYGDGLNRYAYVGGDPLNATDPSGLTGDPQRNETDESVRPKYNDVCDEIVATGTRRSNIGSTSAGWVTSGAVIRNINAGGGLQTTLCICAGAGLDRRGSHLNAGEVKIVELDGSGKFRYGCAGRSGCRSGKKNWYLN